MGTLPWPLMDDSAVRHFVLSAYQPLRYSFSSFLVTLFCPDQNMRPSLPPNLISGYLVDVIHTSWDRMPSKRPSFEKIARDLKIQRASGSSHLLGAAVADTTPPAVGKTLPTSCTSTRSPNMSVACTARATDPPLNTPRSSPHWARESTTTMATMSAAYPLPESIGSMTYPICIVDFEDGDDVHVQGRHVFHQECHRTR